MLVCFKKFLRTFFLNNLIKVSINDMDSEAESIISDKNDEVETLKPPPVVRKYFKIWQLIKFHIFVFFVFVFNKVKVDAMMQTIQQGETKQTWTGEPDYHSYFIVRLFKPTGINVSKMRCAIELDKTRYFSKYLDTPKLDKVKKMI